MGLDMILCVEDERDLTITWRKANAIHRWFVINIQKGQDDCQEYNVTREQLEALQVKCAEVLRYKGRESVAEIHLPTQDGFFFGSTEYDSRYYDNVQTTMEGITKILKHPKQNRRITYSSSW
jgi:hypothetical protein